LNESRAKHIGDEQAKPEKVVEGEGEKEDGKEKGADGEREKHRRP
jgi:hypothetical protein